MSLQCFPYQGWEARLRSRWTQIFLLMLKATVAGDERESPQLMCFGDRGSPQRGRTLKAQGGFCISGSCILCGNSGGGLTAVAQRPSHQCAHVASRLGQVSNSREVFPAQTEAEVRAGVSGNRSGIWLSHASPKHQISLGGSCTQMYFITPPVMQCLFSKPNLAPQRVPVLKSSSWLCVELAVHVQKHTQTPRWVLAWDFLINISKLYAGPQWPRAGQTPFLHM